MTEEQPVLVDVTDGVMTITLNRPKAKNAVNLAVATAVAAALEVAAALGVVVEQVGQRVRTNRHQNARTVRR